MGFAIGFGSIEQAFEDAEEKAFLAFCRERFLARECGYVTDELVADVKDWLNDRAKAFVAQADEYKEAAEHPDRYSYYWVTVLHDASHIVAIFRHSHINRRHALSPDGWALLQSERLCAFNSSRDV